MPIGRRAAEPATDCRERSCRSRPSDIRWSVPSTTADFDGANTSPPLPYSSIYVDGGGEMTKLLVRLGAAVLVLAVVAVGPGTASAGEEQPPDPRDPMQTQMRLIYGADQISAAATNTEGMAGIIVNTDKRELDVYWKGKLPDAVAEAIAKQRNDIGVNLREARYAEAELADAVKRIVEGGGIT